MARRFYGIVTILTLAVVALAVAGCGATTEIMPTPTPVGVAAVQPSPPDANRNASPPPGSAVQDDAGLNLLVAQDGEVMLKRRNWGDYYPVEFGATLGRGDLLRLGDGASALVLCDGLTTWRVPAGAPAGLANGCPAPPEVVLLRGESLVGNTRGAIDSGIPYVILPRRSKVLSPTPLLQWNAVPGVAEYTVSVRGEGVDWTTTTAETSAIYPGDPPLVSGETYALVVETDTGVSSRDEGAPGLGFTLATVGEQTAAAAVTSRVTALRLTPEANTLALTQFYQGQGLYAEAIVALETLVAQGMTSAPVYRHLGDLYRQSGLAALAGDRYAVAIEMAEANGDLESLASAQAGLAEVNVVLGDRDAATALLTAALEGYTTLGDTAAVTALRARLAELGG